MDGSFDDKMVPALCPECGHANEAKVRELERNPTIRCGGCGKDVRVDAAGLIGSLKTVDVLRGMKRPPR